MENQIVLTQESYDAKVKELEQLRTVGRDDIAERIKVARSFGDLSENAEYDEAMNDQAKLEAKIARLENEIKDATILNENELDTETVRIGSKVKCENLDTNETVIYRIKAPSEANPVEGIISDQCPVGRALIGGKKGDTVEAILPNANGTARFKILAISK